MTRMPDPRLHAQRWCSRAVTGLVCGALTVVMAASAAWASDDGALVGGGSIVIQVTVPDHSTSTGEPQPTTSDSDPDASGLAGTGQDAVPLLLLGLTAAVTAAAGAALRSSRRRHDG